MSETIWVATVKETGEILYVRTEHGDFAVGNRVRYVGPQSAVSIVKGRGVGLVRTGSIVRLCAEDGEDGVEWALVAWDQLQIAGKPFVGRQLITDLRYLDAVTWLAEVAD